VLFRSYFGFPGVCWGHRGDNNHGVDEWTDLESVMQSTKVLAVMIMNWCGLKPA